MMLREEGCELQYPLLQHRCNRCMDIKCRDCQLFAEDTFHTFFQIIHGKVFLAHHDAGVAMLSAVIQNEVNIGLLYRMAAHLIIAYKAVSAVGGDVSVNKM